MAKSKLKAKHGYLILLAILVVAFIFIGGFLNPPKVVEAPKEEKPEVVTAAGFVKACQLDTDGAHNFFECTSNAAGIAYVDRSTTTDGARTYYNALGSKVQVCGGSEHLAIECLNLDSIGSMSCKKAISCP